MYLFNPDLETLLDKLKTSNNIYFDAHEAIERQWNKSDIEEIQIKKLKSILEHANSTVPFYKDSFMKHGVNLNEINSYSDLIKLPILSKTDLRTSFSRLVSKDSILKECIRNRTSGTTGEPVVNLHDYKIHNSIFCINAIRQREAWDLRGFQNVLMVIPRHFRTKSDKYPSYKLDLIGFNKVWFISPTEDDLDYVSVLNDIKPDIIYGNPYLMLHLADVIRKSNEKYYLPQIILSSFELLDIRSRDILEDTFKCRICDIYGFSEVGDVAWQCPVSDGYHINEDYLCLEVLDDNGNQIFDREGQIVVTSLYNLPMPLIRYKIGDIGIMTNRMCECGRKTRKLLKIKGRNVDFIIMPSGKRVSPYDIMAVLNLPSIGRYQVIQEKVDYILVKHVQKFDEELKRNLTRRLYGIIDENVEIDFEEVNNIDNVYKDKIRTIISKITGDL